MLELMGSMETDERDIFKVSIEQRTGTTTDTDMFIPGPCMFVGPLYVGSAAEGSKCVGEQFFNKKMIWTPQRSEGRSWMYRADGIMIEN